MEIKLRNIFINESPGKYVPSPELVQAVEIAYALKRPLLLSGEPGTGKTEFARWVADHLSKKGFLNKPFVYNTKSSSTAQDLFYYYDAVAHFRENNTGALNNPNPRKSTEDFIELKAMGLAFAHAKGRRNAQLSGKIAERSQVSEPPVGSVVLVDEIDKAPRDFPNDLLNEIERYEFEIRELNQKIELNDEEKKRILIIMTSNFEKSLPEPFLRRCVYFHIEFPPESRLLEIVKNRLDLEEGQLASLKERIKDFFVIRNNPGIQKKPSTAEFIDWIRVLREDRLTHETLFDERKNVRPGSALLGYLPVLLKMKEDIHLFTPKANA